MAKKKQSKPNPKVLEAQNRNRYMKQMEQLYSKIDPDLFRSLSRERLDIFYSLRGTVIRTCSEQKIPKNFLQFCNDFIRSQMLRNLIEIIPDKLTINLLEYSNYFLPLELEIENIADLFEGREWYTGLLNGAKERKHQYDLYMCAISLSFMCYVNNLRWVMFHLNYKITEEFRSNGNRFVDQKFILKANQPREFRKIFKDKKKKPRTGIELLNSSHVSFEDEDYEPLAPFMILPSRLGVKPEGEEEPLPVIILKHALMRLDERLGCLMSGFTEAQIIPSLLKGNVCHTPEGNLLVEYYLDGKKAGYLQVDIDEGAVLIRTFLFLTNASTPEGQKLREHIGLRKEDVKFLNIDRLTPFMESDILQDEELCTRLKNAGCESLIELCKSLKSSDFFKHHEEKKQLAEKIKKYIQLENPDALEM